MPELQTHVTVNLKEGSFSIAGTESFVQQNIENLKIFIKDNMNEIKMNVPVITNQCSSANTVEILPQNPEQNTDKYQEKGIYFIDKETGEIQILKNIPGKNKANKSRNVALILLYAKNDVINGSDIKKHCVEQACYDQANFASWFKKKDGCFIRQGNGQSWTLRLTIPGKEEAVALLESMIDAK